MAAFIAAFLLLWLLLAQLTYLQTIGENLSPTADRYSEANAIRAAQHYAEHGFFVDAGLPHITYGDRFPGDGWTVDAKKYPLPRGVYTRYPPLPDLLCGLFEKTLGKDHRQRWRLVPVTLSLAATLAAFLVLRRVLLPVVAALLVVALSVIPALATHMHCLHYEGYGHALFVVHLALLAAWLFSGEAVDNRKLWSLFAIGALHGFMSFEYFFVVALAPFPIALLADRDRRTAARMAAASALGFVIAHALHFLQVVAFYGSVRAALADFGSRAQYRFAGAEPTSYGQLVLRALDKYADQLWSLQRAPHFGPYLPIFTAAALILFTVRLSRSKRALGAIFLAHGVCVLWLLAMPAHAAIHTHIVARIFYLAYFVVVLSLASCAPGRSEIAARPSSTGPLSRSSSEPSSRPGSSPSSTTPSTSP